MASKAKTVTATIKLVINAGQAKPAPPVGPALGQAGLNIMSFCKDFNAKTADKKVYKAPLVLALYTISQHNPGANLTHMLTSACC